MENIQNLLNDTGINFAALKRNEQENLKSIIFDNFEDSFLNMNKYKLSQMKTQRKNGTRSEIKLSNY